MLEIKKIKKIYKGKEALKETSLELPIGKVIGILGPNGSGKSTLLRILSQEIQPTSGEFIVDGEKDVIKKKTMISALSSPEFLPKWMTIKDCKNHYVDFYKDFDKEKFLMLLNKLNLTEDLKVSDLSKGMKSKLNLGLTIARNAKYLVLDEPLDGVDPVAREEILSMIVSSFVSGTSLIITSHLINELESLLDEVYFIRDGVIQYMGTASELREENNKSLDELYREVYKNAQFN